jgi:hypothetical protein
MYHQLKRLMNEALELNKPVVIVLPAMYGYKTTTWTATPNEHGGVTLTYVNS